MKGHSAEREGISKLPAPILQHILSFLPQVEAVRTCVLSKLWRYLGSTRPKFILEDFDLGKEKFIDVLDKSLQVYSDQKLCIEEFIVSVSKSMFGPELISLLEKWVPIVAQDLGVKKFYLNLIGLQNSACFVLPAVVFKSESLQELYLDRCNLSQINFIGNNRHLKTLHLDNVDIEEETFAKIMSSCPLIEDLSLNKCKGLRTINVHNYHNLKSFEISKYLFGSSIETYLPGTVRCIKIDGCPNWYRHRSYFPGLTCLRLTSVPLSNEWLKSFSSNFPCLEELQLFNCNGFDGFQLSSRSITYLDIIMGISTKKAAIDAPRIKSFFYYGDISQSISLTTTSSEWKSRIYLKLENNVSLWFPKISELVAGFSQSQTSLVLSDSFSGNQYNIERLSDISVCGGGSYKMPVAMESLELKLDGHFYDSFFSDLVNGLFRIFRPRELKQSWYVNAQEENEKKRNEVNAKEKHHSVELLCKILQFGKSEVIFWQQDIEEISLEVFDNEDKEWHLVQGTISWSEYVAALLKKPGFHQLRFRLKWREVVTLF